MSEIDKTYYIHTAEGIINLREDIPEPTFTELTYPEYESPPEEQISVDFEEPGYERYASPETNNNPPTLTLNGEMEINLDLNEEYVELGAIAINYLDENISSDIVVTDNIDNTVVGVYSVVYQVTDSKNKTTQKTRKVIVRVLDFIFL